MKRNIDRPLLVEVGSLLWPTTAAVLMAISILKGPAFLSWVVWVMVMVYAACRHIPSIVRSRSVINSRTYGVYLFQRSSMRLWKGEGIAGGYKTILFMVILLLLSRAGFAWTVFVLFIILATNVIHVAFARIMIGRRLRNGPSVDMPDQGSHPWWHIVGPAFNLVVGLMVVLGYLNVDQTISYLVDAMRLAGWP